jgi:hypothetical protein
MAIYNDGIIRVYTQADSDKLLLRQSKEADARINALAMRWRGKCHKCNVRPSFYLIGQICRECMGKREASREYGLTLRINRLDPPYTHVPPKGALERTGALND